MVFQPKEGRVESVTKKARLAQERNRFTPAEASSFRGEVGFLATTSFGKLAKSALVDIKRRQYQEHEETALTAQLRAALDLVVCFVYFGGKLWSLSNRRLAALKMYQALSGDEVIWVRCILRNEQHPRFDREFASTLKSEGARIVPFI